MIGKIRPFDHHSREDQPTNYQTGQGWDRSKQHSIPGTTTMSKKQKQKQRGGGGEEEASRHTKAEAISKSFSASERADAADDVILHDMDAALVAMQAEIAKQRAAESVTPIPAPAPSGGAGPAAPASGAGFGVDEMHARSVWDLDASPFALLGKSVDEMLLAYLRWSCKDGGELITLSVTRTESKGFGLGLEDHQGGTHINKLLADGPGALVRPPPPLVVTWCVAAAETCMRHQGTLTPTLHPNANSNP
jgi:hypothetical protein